MYDITPDKLFHFQLLWRRTNARIVSYTYTTYSDNQNIFNWLCNYSDKELALESSAT